VAELNKEIKFTFHSDELLEVLKKANDAVAELKDALEKAEKSTQKLAAAVKEANQATAEARTASRNLRHGRTW